MLNAQVDNGVVMERNVTALGGSEAKASSGGKAVFTNLEENMDYEFRILARTKKGAGPFSERVLFRTERDIVRAPMNVRAMATSYASVEVWWETVPSRGKVIGYTVFYTMTAVEDLDEWQHKSVPVTGSCELVNLERNSQYAVTVAARTKSGYGRLSDKVTVTVKPEDVPTELRAHSVSTHSLSLSWQGAARGAGAPPAPARPRCRCRGTSRSGSTPSATASPTTPSKSLSTRRG